MKEYYHLGELLERIFHHSSSLEQKYIAQSSFKDISANDMHILEAIGTKAELPLHIMNHLCIRWVHCLRMNLTLSNAKN